jgi:hypothetical protein
VGAHDPDQTTQTTQEAAMEYRDYDRDREFREQGYSSREEAEEDREEVRREGSSREPGPADRSRRGPDYSDRGFRGPDFTERDFGIDHERSGRRPGRDGDETDDV